ncbi:MAG: penicillin-binding protein 2 [Patescibacteria group bacterium]
MKLKAISRLRFISFAIILVGLVFVVRLYTLQIMRHGDYKNLGDKQYIKSDGGIFSRGAIYFKDKDGNLISAATLKSGYILTINPKLIKDKEAAYKALSRTITIDRDSFMSHASKTDSYEEIAKRVTEEQAAAIKSAKITGVTLYPMQWRYYPGGDTAAHELGFLGYDANNNFGGRYGLERFYEGTLQRSKDDVYANFFVQIFSDIKGAAGSNSTEGDIVATIEPSVQSSLEDTLSSIQSKWSAKETGGIIMDPKTGAIYAMGSLPNFDPNNFQTEKNGDVFRNPLVEDVREMGSIVKTLTLASGLDAGVITASTTYNDKGFMEVNGSTIWNHDHTINGLTTMQTVLDKSLNMGAAFVEKKLGNDRFAKYMLAFGLGQKTGIDLPNEAQDIVSNLKSPRDVEYVTASFGQGIAMTPVSMIRALAALGNGGVLVTPHLVEKINYGGGLSKNIAPLQGERVISEEASQKISKMLTSVVDNALLSGRAKNPHYTVAAKTGTAQIANPNGGGYYSDRYFHSFMGYFPASDPKFIILLYTLDPETNQFAADTLAMPFADLSKFLINYYQIPPDR